MGCGSQTHLELLALNWESQWMRWVPLERRRKMFSLFLVHRCVTGRAPQCLSENLKTNEEMGHRRTRGLNNLFLPQINSDFHLNSRAHRTGIACQVVWRWWTQQVLSNYIWRTIWNNSTLRAFNNFYVLLSMFVLVLVFFILPIIFGNIYSVMIPVL